jgi:DNA-binding NtrC family response regulator
MGPKDSVGSLASVAPKTVIGPGRGTVGWRCDMPNLEATFSASRRETALLISPVEEDHQTLQHLFQQEGWTLHSVRSLGSATILLTRRVASVVITERDLAAGDWKDVLEAIEGLPQAPLVIVISRLADNSLWAEALNLGVYDVLAKPLDQSEVVRVLTSAWIYQRNACRWRIPKSA